MNKPVAEMTPSEFQRAWIRVYGDISVWWNQPEVQAVVRSYVREERQPPVLRKGKRRWHSLKTHGA